MIFLLFMLRLAADGGQGANGSSLEIVRGRQMQWRKNEKPASASLERLEKVNLGRLTRGDYT
jgi:hypothetical protein